MSMISPSRAFACSLAFQSSHISIRASSLPFRHFPVSVSANRGYLNLSSCKTTANANQRFPAAPYHTVSRREYFTYSWKGRIRKFGRVFRNVVLLGGLCFAIWSIADIWYLLHPPFLSEWPEGLRECLGRAHLAMLADGENALDLLRSAWTSVQNMTSGSLSPNPLTKKLFVAIWLADRLEKNGQDHSAYRVLCDAIGLERDLSGEILEAQSSTQGATNMTESLYVISILGKLAILSERCDRSAESKWLSRAMREIVTFLPLCKGVMMEDYGNLYSQVQSTFSDIEPSFSGLSDIMDSTKKAEVNAAHRGHFDGASTFEPYISEAEVAPEDDLAPFWVCPEVASAVATTIEQVGTFAGRHGDASLALLSYDIAEKTMLGIGTSLSDGGKLLSICQIMLRLHQIQNRRTSLFLKLLEGEDHATEWFYLLHQAFAESSRSCDTLHVIAWNVPFTKLRNRSPFKVREISEKISQEGGIAYKNEAICYQMIGAIGHAIVDFELSKSLLRRCEKYSPSVKLLKDSEAHFDALMRRRHEKSLSLESYMNPFALKEWKEMQKAAAVNQKDSDSPQQQSH